jgi:hypothetical protein
MFGLSVNVEALEREHRKEMTSFLLELKRTPTPGVPIVARLGSVLSVEPSG